MLIKKQPQKSLNNPFQYYRTAAAIAKEANIPRERIFAGVLPKQKVFSTKLHGDYTVIVGKILFYCCI